MKLFSRRWNKKFLIFFTNLKTYSISKKSRIYRFIEFIIIKSNSLSTFLRFLKTKIYFLSFKKFETLQKYFKKIFKKRFINLNNVFFVLFIFFVVKSNEQLKLYIDYRKFNIITKRNIYTIFLIEKILVLIINCKHIFKLDIISIFNKFRMNFNNENFITFICFLNIYKYHVFFFDLINEFVN